VYRFGDPCGEHHFNSVGHSVISKPDDPNRFVLTILLFAFFCFPSERLPEKSTRYSFSFIIDFYFSVSGIYNSLFVGKK